MHSNTTDINCTTDHTTNHSPLLQSSTSPGAECCAVLCAAVRGRETASLVPLLPVFFPRPGCPLAPPRALALYQLTRIHFRLRLRHKSVTSRNLSLLCRNYEPQHSLRDHFNLDFCHFNLVEANVSENQIRNQMYFRTKQQSLQ